MQIISPQQIPGLLQNDIMYTLYANPRTHEDGWYRNIQRHKLDNIQRQKLDNISLSNITANLTYFPDFTKQFQQNYVCVPLLWSVPPTPVLSISHTCTVSPSPPSLSYKPGTAQGFFPLRKVTFFLAIVACFGVRLWVSEKHLQTNLIVKDII